MSAIGLAVFDGFVSGALVGVGTSISGAGSIVAGAAVSTVSVGESFFKSVVDLNLMDTLSILTNYFA